MFYEFNINSREHGVLVVGVEISLNKHSGFFVEETIVSKPKEKISNFPLNSDDRKEISQWIQNKIEELQLYEALYRDQAERNKE